jgi:hypothetical protein
MCISTFTSLCMAGSAIAQQKVDPDQEAVKASQQVQTKVAPSANNATGVVGQANQTHSINSATGNVFMKNPPKSSAGGPMVQRGGIAGGPQAADVCANAPTVGEGTFDYDLNGASNDWAGSCGATGSAQDVWFRYVPSGSGTATASTCGLTTGDSVLAALASCSGPEIVCVDDFCGLQTQISFAVTAGEDYYIRIADFAGGVHAGQIAIALAGGGGPGNDECANATVVTDGIHNFDNTIATGSDITSCAFSDTKDVWFDYTATSTGTMFVQTCSLAFFDTTLALFDSCGGAELACNDDACGLQSRVTLAVTQGQNVKIRVAGYNNQGGSGQFEVGIQQPCTTVQCPPNAAPEGEDCGSDANGGCNSIPPIYGSIPCGGAVCGTIWAAGGTRDTDWYRFSLCVDSTVTWEVTSEAPAVLFILNDNCSNIQLLAQGEAPACGTGSASTFLTAGSYVAFIATGSLSGGIFDGFPCGTDNDYYGTLTYDCTVLDSGACCLPAGGCENVPNAARCAELGGTFTQCLNCSQVFCPCTLTCPPGALDEGEGCGGDTNGGCNAIGTPVTPLECGQTVCGSAWASGGTRDTDWYEFRVCVDSQVTWTAESELPLVLFILNADCAVIQLLAQGEALACQGPGSASTFLPAGVYRAFVATGSLSGGIFDGFPCGDSNDYVATLTYDCTVIDQGRCCLPDGSCIDTNAANCAQQGGDFLQCASCAASPCPAGNDLCEDAIPIGDGIHDFSNIGASQDGPSNCGAMGSDVFFCYTASCTGRAFVTTCGLTTLDTVLSAYEGCDCFGNLLVCLDDFCGLQTRIEFPVVQGQQYLIQIGGFAGGQGAGQFEVGCNEPCVVECNGATPEGEDCGSDTNGGCNSTPNVFGSIACGGSVCGTVWASGGTRDTDWYDFTLAGPAIVSSTVESELPTVTFILSGVCPPAILAIGGNNGCDTPVPATIALGAGSYRLFVATGLPTGGGLFDGFPCDGVNNDYRVTLTCLGQGACCLEGNTCVVTTEADCAARGGDYQGDQTDCGGFSYTQSDCNNAFEDISGTGALGCVGDDCATDVAIGFDFSYFGALYSSVSVGSNGHLRFGAPATRFSNGAIPFADAYDNIICPLWDDWRTDQGGSLYTETRGTAPNRRFIAQWQNVTAFGNPSIIATFQAILFEGTNCIEFRYNGWMMNSPTIGIENADGTAGISVDPNTVAQDDCIQFCGESLNNPCEDPCAGFLLGDSDGSGAVNNFDIDAFVLAISNPPAYIAQFCGGDPQCWLCRNDLDGSTAVNNFDIDPFVDCLNNLPAPGQPCP